MGHTFASWWMSTCASSGPGSANRRSIARTHIAAIIHPERRNAHGLSHAHEIRIVGKIYFAIATIVKQFLPLADHSQRAIVEEHDFDWQVVAAQRRQFLQVHHDRAISGNIDNPRVRKSELCANRCRQTKTHGAQSPAAEVLRGIFEMKMLRHPHLVLTDVASNNAVLTDALGKCFQEIGRVNFRARCGVVPGVSLFRGGALAAPRFNIEQGTPEQPATCAGSRSAAHPRDAIC